MQRIIPAGVLLVLYLVAHALSVHACAWDRDTLEAEAKGIPETVRVITGRFERNPDLYYEMRLARVSRELQSTPDTLELYDDAGVACDRLRRGDEAIAWMQKKRAQMEAMKGRPGVLPAVIQEHRYRTLANEGTFIAHRWLRNGADRKKIAEMKRARNMIAAAIKLNPDAHFGREKYQLQAMEWMIAPGKTKKDIFPSFIEPERKEKAAHEAVEGLSGLIALGDAWNSVDVFYALAVSLQDDNQQSQVAYLTFVRCLELVRNGKSSLAMPNASAANLEKRITNSWAYNHTLGYANDSQQIQAQFKTLRAEADEWHAQRTAYMIERLESGRHPDTDETFWNDWQEPPAPSLYTPSPQELRARRQHYLSIGMAVAGVLFASLWMLRFAGRKKAGQ